MGWKDQAIPSESPPHARNVFAHSFSLSTLLLPVPILQMKKLRLLKILKPSEALQGSRAWRLFFCALFLVDKTPASMTFPEFQRADWNSC